MVLTKDLETTLLQRQNRRNKLVTRNPQLLRVQDALEHILVVGAHVRHNDWRRKEFQRLNQSQSVGDRNNNHNGRQRKRRKKQTVASVTTIHAEDFRIYGTSNDVPRTRDIPTQEWRSERGTKEQEQTRNRIDDSEWNVEHGDSVPPILFRMARLSQEFPSEEQLRLFNDPRSSRMKSLQSTNITVDDRDVPRSLIERCWERAVHAASTAIVTPVANGIVMDPAATARGSGNQNEYLHFDSSLPLSQEMCRKKCESLGVDIDSLRQKARPRKQAPSLVASPPEVCPRCTRSFETPNELLLHYYGNEEAIGCCRALIRPKQLKLVRTLLQSHVQSQTDQLLSIILSRAKAEENASEADEHLHQPTADRSDGNTINKRKEENRTLEWKDVCQFLEDAVKNPTVIQDHRSEARHPVQQSLETAKGADKKKVASAPWPLILNPMVLEAANNRLVDRYANLPR